MPKSNKRDFTIQNIGLGRIKIHPNRPRPNPKVVRQLSRSILKVGLLQPIGLTEDLQLVYGRNRLQAFRELGSSTIPARIMALDELEKEIAEIDENLIRKTLTKMEETRVLRRRKQLYEAQHPETKKGTAGANASNKAQGKKHATEKTSFATDTAQKTGKTARAVRMDVALGEQLQAVPEDVREAVAETPLANNKSQLKALCALDEPVQREVVEIIKGGAAKTVAGALRVIEAPETPEDDEFESGATDEDCKRLEASLTRCVTRWLEKTKDLDAAVKVLRRVTRDMNK